MAGSGGGFLGKLLTFFLGMIFGMIVLVGGIAGGAYWAYSNVKLSQIEKQLKRDLFGDDYKDDTIKQFVSKLSGIGSSMTIGEVEGIFKFINDEINKRYPDGTIPINLSGDTPLGRIDLNVLRQSTIGGVQGALGNVFVITATLRLTESLGIDLPDLPIIKGGGTGAEYYIYTLATDTDDSIINTFSGFTEFYLQEEELELVTVADGKIQGKFRYMDAFFELDGTPVDNTDGILNDSPPPYDLYIKTYSYSLALTGDIGNKPLYVRTDGIIDLPLIEGFNALSAMFDFDTLTLNDMQDKFGFTLGTNFMIDKIKDVPLSKLSQGINDEIDNIELKEIINNDVGSTVINALLYDDLGNPVKVGGIAARVDELKLGDVIGIDDVTSPKILVALKNYKLDELSGAINTLAIEEIVEIPADNNILNSIKHATLATLPDVLNDLTLQDIVGTDIYDMELLLTSLEISNAYFDANTDIYIFDGTVYIKIDKQEYFNETGDLKTEYSGTDLYVKGDVKPSIWRYIVMDNVGGVMTEVPVSINNIASRMNNVAANINNSPLGELHANGVITLDDTSMLNKKFPAETLTLGEMTITQILNKISGFVF